jgi:hypothetical protein
MSSLKQALVITKNTSQKDFEEIYGMIKDKYFEEVELSGYDIDELVASFKQLHITMDIKQIKGISVSHQGKEKKLFSHAEYGWDGGSAIYTEEFNLKTLDTNDFGGGPIASIVTLQNENYPGFALHYDPSKDLGEINIFM